MYGYIRIKNYVLHSFDILNVDLHIFSLVSFMKKDHNAILFSLFQCIFIPTFWRKKFLCGTFSRENRGEKNWPRITYLTTLVVIKYVHCVFGTLIRIIPIFYVKILDTGRRNWSGWRFVTLYNNTCFSAAWVPVNKV